MPIKVTNSTPPPDVIYKEEEFNEMLSLIENEYVYSDTNLSAALHVDRSTIAGWKKRPEAIKAHKEAVKKALGERRRKGQLQYEKTLKELGVETEVDKLDLSLKVIIEDYTT